MQVDFEYQTRTYLGLYEIELNRYLREMLRRGVTTFDIGAQFGYDSLLAANQTQARVASFECARKPVAEMRRNFALNPALEKLITIVEGFVGNGEREIGLDDWASSDEGFVPDVVKIDVDGGELGVLRSASQLLSTRQPSLVVETHTSELEHECGRLLVDHGYKPTIVNQRRLYPDRRTIPHNRWLVAVGRDRLPD
jgi:hypothetical protein